MTGSCSQCGECCKWYPIGTVNGCTSPTHLAYLRERCDKEENGVFLLYSPCHHLGDDGLCGIYEKRPLACRLFTGKAKVGKMSFYVPGACTWRK